jgi:hypothetical protein
MKKLTTSILVMVCASFAFAQPQQSIGLGVSANLPTTAGFSPGYGVHAQFETPLSRTIAFQPSIGYQKLYSQRIELSTPGFSFSGRASGGLGVLNLPVNFYIKEQFYFQAGPSLYIQDNVSGGATLGIGYQVPAGKNLLDIGLKTENLILGESLFNIIALKATYCLDLRK